MIDRFLCLDAYLSVYHILYKINLFLLHWDRNVLFSNTYQNFHSFIHIPYSDGFYHRFARPFQLESVRLGILCEVKVFPQTHFAVCSSWSLNFFNIFFIFIEKKKAFLICDGNREKNGSKMSSAKGGFKLWSIASDVLITCLSSTPVVVFKCVFCIYVYWN